MKYEAPDAKRGFVYVCRLLSRRGYHSAEIRHKLLSKGYSEEMAADILEQVGGLLNDELFFDTFVWQQLGKLHGTVYMEHYLRMKDIALPTGWDELRERHFAERLDELARRVARKYQKALQEGRWALEQVLWRRGFDQQEIFRIMEHVGELAHEE